MAAKVHFSEGITTLLHHTLARGLWHWTCRTSDRLTLWLQASGPSSLFWTSGHACRTWARGFWLPRLQGKKSSFYLEFGLDFSIGRLLTSETRNLTGSLRFFSLVRWTAERKRFSRSCRRFENAPLWFWQRNVGSTACTSDHSNLLSF